MFGPGCLMQISRSEPLPDFCGRGAFFSSADGAGVGHAAVFGRRQPGKRGNEASVALRRRQDSHLRRKTELQRPGYALGYDIIEIDKDNPQRLQQDFTAYKVRIPNRVSEFTIRLVDTKGRIYAGSVRNLQSLREPSLVLLAIAALTFASRPSNVNLSYLG